MAYDVDHSTSGTLYEYNISHNNEGGFMLLCPYDKPTQNFTIRYNLSVNDRARVFQLCYGDLVNGRIYKNTIYVGDGVTQQMVLGPGGYNFDTLVEDNTVIKAGAGKIVWNLNSTSTGFQITNNIFNGPIDKYDRARNTIVDSPRLAAPGVRDPFGYMFLQDSAAYDAGIVVNGGDAPVDFFGNPTDQHNNMGFYSGAPTTAPQWVSTFDDGNLTGWTPSGCVSIVKDPVGDLGRSVKLKAGGAIARAYEGENLSVHVQIRLTEMIDDPERAMTLCVGEACTAFSAASVADLNVWNTIIVEVSNHANQTLTLNGKPREVNMRSVKTKAGEVTISAGRSTIYLDDIFVFSV